VHTATTAKRRSPTARDRLASNGGPKVRARTAVVAALASLAACSSVLALGAGSAAAATAGFGEEGQLAGQLKDPFGVAVNQETDDVFVADQYNWRVDRFAGSGSFSLAWGWHVNEESPAEELQTCTAFCESGRAGTGAGTFASEGPRGVAVDNDPLSPSHGDVYVTDWENHRVQKFGPGGEFLLMFGWEVNETTHGNVCVAGEACKAGVEGEKEEGINEDGQFRWAYEGSYIAVGPGGDVYVGDQARVQVFTPTGAWKENIPLSNPEFPGFAKVTALAVNASGDIFFKAEEAPGVRELESNGTETSARFDASAGFPIAAVALDPAGNVYVADTEPTFHVLKYDPAGKQISTFGAGAVVFPRGMAFADATSELYVADATNSDVVALAATPSGPLISGEAGTAAPHGQATLQATVNPEGHETTYHFEYVTEQQYAEDGDTFGAGTVATGAATLAGAEFEAEQVEAKLPEGTLVPGQVYRWRLLASNECEESRTCTNDGAPQTLEETPPAQIDGPWATGVTATSATLAARIDPQGASTTYRVQYGTSTAYEHEFSGSVAADSAFVAVGGFPLQELRPGTTYHFRVVTVNECITGRTCTQDGADHAFTTRPPASGFALPDGRAWELVTPADTGGATLELSPGRQAASDGSAITYQAHGATLGENAVSNNSFNATQVLSRRGTGGWRSQDINGPIPPAKEGENYSKEIFGAGHFALFSPDLTSALYTPQDKSGVLVAEALEGTTYLRNLTCSTGEPINCYGPLLSPANTPPGTKLMYPEGVLKKVLPEAQQLAGTPDLAHFILGSPLALTAGAHAYTPPEITFGYGNLYEWNEGRLQLVSVLPKGTADESDQARPAGQGAFGSGQLPRVLSEDGRRVAWVVGNRYSEGTFRGLYVRDMVEEKTVHVGGPTAAYQTMSSDGSHVFFLEHGDLFDYHVAPGAPYDSGTTTDLTAGHGPGESSAGVHEIVSDVSEDGSYVYFVATGVLSSAKSATGEEALAGADNLFAVHNEGGAWAAPRFLARLSDEDEPSWAAHSGAGSTTPEVIGVSSRVSPDGRYLAFMSSRSLTGYDNVDLNPAANGARDEEVFLYHAPGDLAAESGSLICASCDPSGARPHGVPDGFSGEPPFAAGPNSRWGEAGHPHWLAGNVPAWEGQIAQNVYQPRYLSDGGRLFFNSPVALVPQDTNGLEDVYQYEPAGSGGVSGCASARADYRARTGGCVDLISSGQSATESAFLDAGGKGPGGEDAEDVFFLSSYHLTPADTDVGYDVWDAHVCSVSSPCITPPVSPPPCASGDSCKPAPSPQPELFGAAPSATFSGAGNVPASKPAVKQKALTRAQKLSKALVSCRKQYRRSKKRRAACERTARRRYRHPQKRAGKAKATKRGGK
jgi:DNA-binding beta-propeller fold protein YncE